jgi:hypothetical protein
MVTAYRSTGYGFSRIVLWPSAVEWNAILRGAASIAGLDGRHTLLCHLTQKVVANRRVPIAAARRFVISRIAAHVELLLMEFGLPDDHTHAVADRVHTWLDSMQGSELPYVIEAYWPTADEWLAIDRGAAAHAYLDGRFTLSTNLASIVTQARSVSFDVAKRWVHQRIATHAQQLARELGYGIVTAWVTRARIVRWLDSFDAA